MPDLKPLDDIKTYRSVADEAYARKAAKGVTNPRAVTAARMDEAENGSPVPVPPPNSPASVIPGVKFTKGFTPDEKAAQAKALALKLKARDAEDAKESQ